jgi:hypothetical protein
MNHQQYLRFRTTGFPPSSLLTTNQTSSSFPGTGWHHLMKGEKQGEHSTPVIAEAKNRSTEQVERPIRCTEKIHQYDTNQSIHSLAVSKASAPQKSVVDMNAHSSQTPSNQLYQCAEDPAIQSNYCLGHKHQHKIRTRYIRRQKSVLRI